MNSCDDVVQKYQKLKQRRDSLEKKKIEYTVRLENMRTEYKGIISSLQSEYGVANLEEAITLKNNLEQALQTKYDELSSALDLFEQEMKKFQSENV